MNIEWNDISATLAFLKENTLIPGKTRAKLKVIISDDENEVHTVTKMAFRNFEFEGSQLQFLDAYTGEETKNLLRTHTDTVILIQDVVMERNSTGLDIVNYLRNELNNDLTRIILRTGQPGEAPEAKIVKDYDINDYCLKTELTVSRLHTTMYTALRSYRDLYRVKKYKKGLEKIIETSASLFSNNTPSSFLSSILEQLSSFYVEETDIVYVKDVIDLPAPEKNGFVAFDTTNKPTIIAATGKFTEFVGKELPITAEFKEILHWIYLSETEKSTVQFLNNGFIIRSATHTNQRNFIYIEGTRDAYDFELIQLFLSHYSVALDNFMVTNMVFSTQKDLILTLGEVIDHQFDETGSHVKRISDMMFSFSSFLGFSYAECEKIRLASSMHDVGKVAISEAILKKPGKLTAEEFEKMKEHSNIGHRILKKSELEIFRIAADIAYSHHERFDGSGYPLGLAGKNIPLQARVLAILDVFDAMTHNRVYKDKLPQEEAVAYITEQKNKHFDAQFVDIFLQHYDEITGGCKVQEH